MTTIANRSPDRALAPRTRHPHAPGRISVSTASRLSYVFAGSFGSSPSSVRQSPPAMNGASKNHAAADIPALEPAHSCPLTPAWDLSPHLMPVPRPHHWHIAPTPGTLGT